MLCRRNLCVHVSFCALGICEGVALTVGDAACSCLARCDAYLSVWDGAKVFGMLPIIVPSAPRASWLCVTLRAGVWIIYRISHGLGFLTIGAFGPIVHAVLGIYIERSFRS